MSISDHWESSERDEQRSRLLVIESGAPAWIGESRESFDQNVAITQLQGESPADFAERVLRRLAFAAKSSQCFAAAALLVGPSYDEPTCTARRMVGLAMAEYAQSARTLSELVAVAAADASQPLRERLLELADELLFGADGALLSVRICFVEATKSAVRSQLPLASARGREKSPAASQRARDRRTMSAGMERAPRDE
jgi:hypothetical protein